MLHKVFSYSHTFYNNNYHYMIDQGKNNMDSTCKIQHACILYVLTFYYFDGMAENETSLAGVSSSYFAIKYL